MPVQTNSHTAAEATSPKPPAGLNRTSGLSLSHGMAAGTLR